jgi:hypothetical protein
MIIEFWSRDRPPITIDDERGKRLINHITKNEPKFLDFSADGYGLIAVGDVKGIGEATDVMRWNGTTNSLPLTDEKRLELNDGKLNGPPLSNEKAVERIRKMKQDFLNRKGNNEL